MYQLAGFHVVLWTRGQTTYDFIVEQQQKHRGGGSGGDGGNDGGIDADDEHNHGHDHSHSHGSDRAYDDRRHGDLRHDAAGTGGAGQHGRTGTYAVGNDGGGGDEEEHEDGGLRRGSDGAQLQRMSASAGLQFSEKDALTAAANDALRASGRINNGGGSGVGGAVVVVAGADVDDEPHASSSHTTGGAAGTEEKASGAATDRPPPPPPGTATTGAATGTGSGVETMDMTSTGGTAGTQSTPTRHRKI